MVIHKITQTMVSRKASVARREKFEQLRHALCPLRDAMFSYAMRYALCAMQFKGRNL